MKNAVIVGIIVALAVGGIVGYAAVPPKEVVKEDGRDCNPHG